MLHTHTHTRMLGSQQPLLQDPYETLQHVAMEASRNKPALSWLHSHFQSFKQWEVMVLSVVKLDFSCLKGIKGLSARVKKADWKFQRLSLNV